MYHEDKVVTKKLCEKKINRIQILRNEIEPNVYDPKFGVLLVHTDYGITSYNIKKGVKTTEMEGHTEPILKIIVLEPSKMLRSEEEKVPDSPKVITCSLDNTILLWDFEKMEIITKMEAPEHSELSCMTFLYNCCLVATGHEDGAIRLWNMEINSSVLLKCNESQKHKNTISCIHGTVWKDSEFLLCGSYDGKISVWEISEKKASGGGNQHSSTIYPQLRHLIDNTKV